MKSLNGFLQNFDDAGLVRSNLRVAYDFMESGVTILNKAPNYSGQYLGLLSGNSDTFFAGSGTGLAQSDFISISGQLYSNNFTHFFHISRQQAANDNFYSSLGEGISAASGYSISTNDAGKLLFQYKDCSGPKSITSDFSLNQDSHFAVSKQGNAVNLYQYTPGSNTLDVYGDTVNDSEIFTSNYADLFFANTAPVGFLKDYFSGYILDYLYFNVGLSSTQIRQVISGLHADLVVNSTGACGFLSGSIFVMPTGASFTSTVTIPSSTSLNRNGIVLLRPVSLTDIIVVDYSTGNNGSIWNKTANFNTLDSDFYLQDYSTNPPNIYLNGVKSISGLSEITGQYCSTGRAFSRDYQFSGQNRIADAGQFSAADTVIYDIPSTQNVWQQLFSGGNSVNLGGGEISGRTVYLNGQRICSGKDYLVSGAILVLNQAITSGDLICCDYFKQGTEVLEELYATGWFYTSGAYTQGSSRVFMNGVRQLLNTDYREISSGSLLRGSPIDPPNNIVVAIDNILVWNI